jgi:two-component system, OmpR family, response regulator RegX3
MKNRIVVVDDDSVTTKVVKLVLDDAGYDPVIVQTASTASEEIVNFQTHLAIIDVEVDGVCGFDLYKELRARGYLGPVIFTSVRPDMRCKLEAFGLGADDFVGKPFDPLELLARVGSVLKRFRIAEENSNGLWIHVADAELSVGKLTYKSDVVSSTVLTPTEMKILECLMRNHGIIISRSTLIERLWGFEFAGDTNRVDVYIRRVRRKIERDPANPEYLHTVRGIGYVFRAERSRTRDAENLPAYHEAALDYGSVSSCGD